MTVPGCDGDLKILNHHIYEFRKGLRNLVLHTIPMWLLHWATERLQRDGISYVVRPVNPGKVNIFFGEEHCVNVIASFGEKPLNQYTPEEDFILGIMLGYGRLAQCARYLDRREKTSSGVCG